LACQVNEAVRKTLSEDLRNIAWRMFSHGPLPHIRDGNAYSESVEGMPVSLSEMVQDLLISASNGVPAFVLTVIVEGDNITGTEPHQWRSESEDEPISWQFIKVLPRYFCPWNE